MKIKRKEYDEMGELLLRKAKELDPSLTPEQLVRLFGRLYSRMLKQSKEET